MERRLAAILAADVVGYARLMGADEAGTLARLMALHRDLVRPRILARKGRVVKLMGDGLLADFPSVVEAVTCAIEIQRAMAERDPGLAEDRRIALRIGVNLGDILIEGNDIFGDGVNVAARLEGLAEPNGICISAAAFDAIDGKIDAAFEDLGPHAVKNIARPVRAYRARLDTGAGGGSGDGSGGPSGAECETARARAEDTPILPDKPSVAVLPFAAIPGGGELDAFADGITEEIVTTLSKVSKLFVIARTAMLAYKDRSVDVRTVGRELGVRCVLEGSVRGGGARIRVTAQLIEAATGQHLWARRYDREPGDILALQDDVTKEIVSALQVELTEGEQARIAAQGTQDVEAWQLAFEGRDLVHAHHKDTVRKGCALLEEAVGRDPDYAFAWGALAEAHWKEARNEGWSASPERSMALAIEASDRALALDPENAGILAMRSVIMTTRRDFEGARALAGKALRAAHSDANAIALAAITLYACGEPAEAIHRVELAMRLCPRYPPWYPLMLARCHWMLGHGEEAMAAAEAAIEADPYLSLAHVVIAMVHAEAGRVEAARRTAETILTIDPGFSARAYLNGLPLSDPAQQERRRKALDAAGLPS